VLKNNCEYVLKHILVKTVPFKTIYEIHKFDKNEEEKK
jgi:hypothetical protein